MKTGNIVEYIDRQRIMCAVVLEVKKQRLRLLTETNREINLSVGRLSHNGEISLDLSVGRDNLVEILKNTARRREALTRHVDIKELWEILNSEQDWIDLTTMTEFCFPDEPDYDHESAVVRAFFKNRLYFKFNHDRFFPNSEERVEQIAFQNKEAERRKRIIDTGVKWLKKKTNGSDSSGSQEKLTSDQRIIVKALKSFYLFEKESHAYSLGRAILERAGITDGADIFRLLVKLGIWDEDENIDLQRFDIPTTFPEKVSARAAELVDLSADAFLGGERNDLTHLPLITIDGQSTLDFDDALSIEKKEDHFVLGVHISDVGHYIAKGDIIDQEAAVRASSIYMPDRKISMVPALLAEDLCSLKAGELRPAISSMIRLSNAAEIIDYEIFASTVRVAERLSYYDVNLIADERWEIAVLYDIAKKFRQKRLDQGALHILLPEISIWIDKENNLTVSKTNRESPGRMLIAEIMIMANWLSARFLQENHMPSIYRSQPEPRDRLFKKSEGSVYQNWMQRKYLSRFVLSPEPDHHSGLGLNAYVTATSPIRKYYDLATQRQIRAVLGLEVPYSAEQVSQLIQQLEEPMSNVGRVQYNRHRYWLLKYLEGKIGQKEEAIVLAKRRNSYLILLTEYMIECNLPLSTGIDLKPEDMIQVTLQQVSARNDVLAVFLG